MSLYAELKRRNVFRVAAAYLVLGWLFLQISSVVLQFVGAPDWVGKAIIALLVIGFIPSLAIAWVFEVGPGGIQRDSGAIGDSNGRHGRRLDILTLIGVVVVALIAFVEQLRVPDATRVPGTVSGVRTAVPTKVFEPETVPGTSSPPTPPPNRASIAVLPFANMSPDPENEFFADGISEELLNILSAIDGLKVASRTSAFAFKGKDANIGEVARTLKVAHVLEGSVRKQGLRVRITAQLIDAGNDQHLWSDTYDRELTDIFAVQEEIAQAISSAMSGALGVATGTKGIEVAPPTADLAAYELYLRGRQLFHQRGKALLAARRVLEQAVERDPAFAPAWAVLSATYVVSPDYVAVTTADAHPLARRAAERAIALDDGLALAYSVLGQLAAAAGDRLEAERLLTAAIERDDDDPTARLWRGLHFLDVGDLDRAGDDFRRAVEIEPFAGVNHAWYGLVRAERGERAAALAAFDRAAELGWAATSFFRLRIAMSDGDRARAVRELQAYFDQFDDIGPESRAVIDAAVAMVLDPAARERLERAVSADTTAIHGLGWGDTLLVLGLHQFALDVELSGTLPAAPSFTREVWVGPGRGVVSLPDFVEYAHRTGLLAYWQARGFPGGCRLVDTPERHLDCSERTR